MSTVQMQKLIELMETAEMGNDIRARARALNKELAKSGWTDGKSGMVQPDQLLVFLA